MGSTPDRIKDIGPQPQAFLRLVPPRLQMDWAVSESDSNRLGNAISVMLCMGHQTLAKRRDMSLTLAT